jgi:hypothetical protein
MESTPISRYYAARIDTPSFELACSGRPKEAETGIIDLGEDDPEAIKHMIECTRAI